MKKAKNNIDLITPLKHYFGFDAFKQQQEPIIRSLLDGKDVFVLMPTGGGKSLCYQLPALLQDGVAVVVSPLIALMKNQVDMLRHNHGQDAVAHFLNSSLTRKEIEQVKADVLDGKTKLLYVAPESLAKEENVALLKGIQVSLYAIDEAHCISEWGHDFRPEYRKIRSVIQQIGHAPIIALTATATEKVKADIKKNLGIGRCREYKSSFNRPNLYYEVRPKTKDVDKEIIKFLRARGAGRSGIIYCLSRRKVEELSEVLKANGIKAAPYHAGLEAKERAATQDDFLMERIDVIVATIAFGMGIDKPDVRFVIHYDIPKSLEGYYQETGRAGRDGGEGHCLCFYSPKDIKKLEKFMEGKPIAEQDIGRQLLKETAAYAESRECRRKLLLHYFGEEYTPDNCHQCDNCQSVEHPRTEASEVLTHVLQAVMDTKGKATDDYIKDLLLGHNTEEISAHKHHKHPLFGALARSKGEGTQQILSATIRRAMMVHYIEKDVETYGQLHITDEGKAYLNAPTEFYVSPDREFSDDYEAEAEMAEGGISTVDPVLYAMLKDLRRHVSKEKDVPPYVIFQDPSLEAMAMIYPQTIEELRNIPGVGAGKAARYGAAFCRLIKQHCEDNNITRPEDYRIRTVAKKSKLKADIIQYIDRKVDLEDIAVATGIEFEDLLNNMETIVYSGTRINIDYFIDEYMDEDRVQDIYLYFKESETDDINAAMTELGRDYTEEEIRLIRIKFMSELGN